ncbi:hypothetical protein GCM10022223_51330 [Kineosporia mesophila]|uniref:Uncharacterized protein n=1 Tax=Kineosporia mesophila TaxID=566012 RepID=A0ABP7A9V9_9ACTN
MTPQEVAARFGGGRVAGVVNAICGGGSWASSPGSSWCRARQSSAALHAPGRLRRRGAVPAARRRPGIPAPDEPLRRIGAPKNVCSAVVGVTTVVVDGAPGPVDRGASGPDVTDARNLLHRSGLSALVVAVGLFLT